MLKILDVVRKICHPPLTAQAMPCIHVISCIDQSDINGILMVILFCEFCSFVVILGRDHKITNLPPLVRASQQIPILEAFSRSDGFKAQDAFVFNDDVPQRER